MKKVYIAVLFVGILLSACSGNASDNDAELATEEYIKALANKDKALITNLSCKEWEESAILEIDGLLSVDAEVNNLECFVTNKEGDNTLVVCNGSLDLTYNDEIRAIDLSRRTYYLQENNGQWQICEYK